MQSVPVGPLPAGPEEQQEEEEADFFEVPGEQGSLQWLKGRVALDVTGADAAKAVGCGAYGSAEMLRESKLAERQKSDDQLLQESNEFGANVHTRAGRANEDPIARAASRLLFEFDVKMETPPLCISRNPEWRFFGASIDRVVRSESDGILRALLECKFSFDGIPLHPKVDHIFQTQMQMRVYRFYTNYLCYGTRLAHPTDYNEPLQGPLALRIYRIQFSQDLWDWTWKRLKIFHQSFETPAHSPAHSLEQSLPTMNLYVNHVWFESPGCRDTASACEECKQFHHECHPRALEESDYLPPPPRWSVVVPQVAAERPFAVVAP